MWKLVAHLHRHWRGFALMLGVSLSVLLGMTGAGVGAERGLHDWQWRLRAQQASGELHIVEIDAKSIATIDRWPWPRSNYAPLIDRLRQAGAASIAFDVDFSARSTRAEDQALAGALQRAGGKVVLPTFRQAAGSGRAGWVDALPAAPLADHATLAAVSILPDPDGYVRRAPIGTITRDTPRPSLSAIIAGRSGAADQDFPIDFSLTPASIPRHSFVDIRDGKFDPADIAGKQILIGATAIEMGDRYAVPLHGVIPGVVIQALAVETLRNGVPVEAGWPLPLLVALALAVVALKLGNRRTSFMALAAAPLALFGLATLSQSMFNWWLPTVPSIALLFVVGLSALVMRVAEAIQERRTHDAETGLPNRAGLRQHTPDVHAAGIVVARIPEFDRLTAGLGVGSAAELVKRICDRIGLIAEGATIFRVEDRVLAWWAQDASVLDERFVALRSAMLNPIEVHGRRADVTLALGFAHRETGDAEGTLAKAALAAHRAMRAGVAWHIHAAEEEAVIERELSLLGELDEAIGKGELRVVYQPKLDLASNRITSVEALVRWQHPTRGFLAPDLFIPLAEKGDRIEGLTLYVVGQTINQLLAWQAAGHAITGGVNLSAKLLSDGRFITELQQLVCRSGIDPHRLIFEVTESAAMLDPEAAVEALSAFRDMGIAISMDDYGTGQSTLSYIKQLPLSELKIDRSFVQFAHQNRGDGVLVRSTINLAHDLGLKVVAEGVEEAECLNFLRSVGCDMIQGYFISRPVSANDLTALLGEPAAQAA